MKSKDLDRAATRLLLEDRQAASFVADAAFERAEQIEATLRSENGGELPPASVLANELFESYSKWRAASMKAGVGNESPSLLSDFLARADLFCRSYGENVYLPTLFTAGALLTPRAHDVDRMPLRLVHDASKKEG